jgi:sugar-specific transcriptional regulator TrmB
MAHPKQDVIRSYFAKLDLAPELADIYLVLCIYGPQTMAQLSRNVQMERTKLYRLMEVMKATHLCSVEVRGGRTRVVPEPAANLQLLIARREKELGDLRDEFSAIEKILDDKKGTRLSGVRVTYYKGDAGLKQMLWNETRSGGESVSILAENSQVHTGEEFFERWVRKRNEQHLHSRSIVGDRFIASLQAWYTTHQNERLDNWQGRYIPETVLKMTRSMVVYDDFVTYFGRKAGESFGIEIYDPELANTQRSIFEMLWAQGTDLSKAQAKPHLDDE